MLKISFKGPLKKVLGVGDMELEGGRIEEVLEEISEMIGADLIRKDGKIYMVFREGGRETRTRISVLFNGKNVEREGIHEVYDGSLEIITPLGGG